MADRKRNFALEQRLRFIDFLLDHYGRLNRGALVDYFGISVPQASIDIRTYQEHAGAEGWRDPCPARVVACLGHAGSMPATAGARRCARHTAFVTPARVVSRP